jgi:hypothetical protein
MNKHLIPREHGAYAQLGFPMLSGLLLGSPGVASWLFVAAAALLFVANEPLVVLLGARGKRLQQELGGAARRHLAVLGSLGVLAGLAALWLASPQARALALVPAAMALGLLPVVLGKRLKSLSGEMVAAGAFSAMHLPVAAAGGVAGVLLWGPAAMWFVTTVVATLCVHAIKARVTGAARWTIPASAWAGFLSLGAGAAMAALVPDWRAIALAACLPLAGVVVINRLAPSPKRLKHVGWTVVAANALAVTLLTLSG